MVIEDIMSTIIILTTTINLIAMSPRVSLYRSSTVQVITVNALLQVKESADRDVELTNILRLYGYFYDEERVYLILEYAARGSVYGQLKKENQFSETFTAKIIYQLADALTYCHQKNVIHRDIKPENLLLSAKADIKIADFGWSVHAPTSKYFFIVFFFFYKNNLIQMLIDRAHDHNVDNWSVGVLLYEFLVGKPPFEHDNSAYTMECIKHVRYSFPTSFPDEARKLVSRLLVLEPSHRLSLQEIKSHKWVQHNLRD
uniref:Aurora kinase n=1 Tax=Ditylenchus dipsaci TaxID=166011 RepID=A0A915EG40_9BILA